MRVLHVVPSYFPATRYGGPIVSVRELCRAVADAGVEIDVATTNADGPRDLEVPTDEWVRLDGLRVRYFRRWPRIDYALSPDLYRYLAHNASAYQLIHVTSTFSFPSAAAGIAARRHGVPYVVSPRGSLQEWSLKQKRWKKVPYWHLIERRHLELAAAIHATADLEAQAVKKVLPRSRVFVSPNGIDLDPGAVAKPARKRERVVFLGRIHRKKGLDILARAASILMRRFPELEVVIAGPDDTGERPRVESIIDGLTPRPRIRWMGHVEGGDKWNLLASARLFALPSHSENFGIAVVEALACGTPVVVSRNCPWEIVEERGAGAWVENEPAAFADAMGRILGDDQLAGRMESAARDVASQFAWKRIGQDMATEYKRIAEDHRRQER